MYLDTCFNDLKLVFSEIIIRKGITEKKIHFEGRLLLKLLAKIK